MSFFVAESLLNVSLTRLNLFHSHLENLPSIQQNEIKEQVGYFFIINRKVS